jgi:F0F1-type ATP synthase delta subunit
LKKFFNNKELLFIEDKSLIAGIRIIDYDIVYELNLKDSLENMIRHVQKSYD